MHTKGSVEAHLERLDAVGLEKTSNPARATWYPPVQLQAVTMPSMVHCTSKATKGATATHQPCSARADKFKTRMHADHCPAYKWRQVEEFATHFISLKLMLEHVLVCTEGKIQHVSISGRGNDGVARFTVGPHASPVSLVSQSLVDFQHAIPLSSPALSHKSERCDFGSSDQHKPSEAAKALAVPSQ